MKWLLINAGVIYKLVDCVLVIMKVGLVGPILHWWKVTKYIYLCTLYLI